MESRVLLEVLRVAHLVNKIPIFYGTRKFIRPPLDATLSQINPVDSLTTQFFKIHFNIILPFTTASLKWSLARKTRLGDTDFPYVNRELKSVYVPIQFSCSCLEYKT
jgi:hypothetical protein